MSPATEPVDPFGEQVNQMYWHSDETVDGIVSSLGRSRKAVYAAIEPLPAGAQCAGCGEPLVFLNRTSRSAGMANCSACGAQEEVGGVVTAAAMHGAGAVSPASRGPRNAPSREEAQNVKNGVSRWEQLKEDLAAVPVDRAAKIGGAAALGVALGAAAVKVIKKRG
jgi:hypothetical protein